MEVDSFSESGGSDESQEHSSASDVEVDADVDVNINVNANSGSSASSSFATVAAAADGNLTDSMTAHIADESSIQHSFRRQISLMQASEPNASGEEHRNCPDPKRSAHSPATGGDLPSTSIPVPPTPELVLPETIRQNPELHALLVSWYWAGYHTGRMSMVQKDLEKTSH